MHTIITLLPYTDGSYSTLKCSYHMHDCKDTLMNSYHRKGCQYIKAVAIDTNSLVALRATKLLLTPTQSCDYILITAQYQ